LVESRQIEEIEMGKISEIRAWIASGEDYFIHEIPISSALLPK